MPLLLVAVLGLPGNIIMIVELALVVSFSNVDCQLQLGLRASTVSLKDRFEEPVPFRGTYRSAAGMGGFPLHHCESQFLFFMNISPPQTECCSCFSTNMKQNSIMASVCLRHFVSVHFTVIKVAE